MSAASNPDALVIDDDDDDEPPMLVSLNNDESVVPKTNNTEKDAEDQQPQNPVKELPPCPVTILSGFLGSGKTTLIQYILRSPNHGKRIAVIENEFGEGLSVESLIARDGVNDDNDKQGETSLQDLIELPNGCICCTVKDSLVQTLENLIEKRHDLDYILIEASGMANPGPIASVFWLDDELQSRIRLDGIVTIVDAYHIHSQLKETQEASQQVAYADRILVNKVDLLSNSGDIAPSKSTTTTLEQVMSSIRAINQTAPIQTTTFSQVPDLDWILDAQCFGGKDRLQELDRVLNDASQLSSVVSSASEHGHHHHDHDHDHESCEDCAREHEEHHRHTTEVSTIAIQQQGSLDLAKMNTWLAEILWPNQDAPNQVLNAMLDEPSHGTNNDRKEQDQVDGEKTQLRIDLDVQTIFRIKGILSVKHSDISLIDDDEVKRYLSVADNSTQTMHVDSRRYIVQAVHDLWDIHPASDDLQWTCHDVASETERICKLVIIGRSLKHDELRSGFSSCFV